MILKASEKTRKEVESIKATAKKERGQLKGKIKKVKADIEAAEKAAEDAKRAGDIEKVITVQRELKTLTEEVKPQYEQYLREIRAKQLITKAEYDRSRKAIIAEADEHAQTAAKEIAAYIEKAAAVAADLCEACTDADEVIYQLRGIYTHESDQTFFSKNDRALSEAWGIVDWVQSIVNHPTFRYMIGEDYRGDLNIMQYLNRK